MNTAAYLQAQIARSEVMSPRALNKKFTRAIFGSQSLIYSFPWLLSLQKLLAYTNMLVGFAPIPVTAANLDADGLAVSLRGSSIIPLQTQNITQPLTGHRWPCDATQQQHTTVAIGLGNLAASHPPSDLPGVTSNIQSTKHQPHETQLSVHRCPQH